MAAFSSSSSSSSSYQQQNLTFLLQSSSALQQLTSYYNNNYSSISPPPFSAINNKTCFGPLEEQQKYSHLHHDHIISSTTKAAADLCSIVINDHKLGCSAYHNTNNNNAIDSSSIVADNINKAQQKKVFSMEKKRKSNEGPSSNSPNKEKKLRKTKDGEGNNNVNKKNKSKELKKADAESGYIHVRARRGQATDSHSLAERVRREKISERMKQLQALVPGCAKVTGKALMLDEIINYVQSLQNQVEFLSMKLASTNPTFYDFGMDLESFMVRPDQDLNNLPSTLQDMQQMSPTLTANHYPLFNIDDSANSLLLHHAHISSIALPQNHRQVLWEVDEHRYYNKIMNQSGVSDDACFSFD